MLPCLIAAFACAGLARAELEDPALRAKLTELPNGLTVLTLPKPGTPVVSFQMWIRVGSGDESRYTGLAHLFEHMMFRGTERLPPEAHERLIEPVRAALSTSGFFIEHGGNRPAFLHCAADNRKISLKRVSDDV